MLDDFCEQYDYEEFIDDGTGGSIPNPQSKSDFANEQITRFIRESVHAARLTAGREAITIEELDL
jgi:hypothetical protein